MKLFWENGTVKRDIPLLDGLRTGVERFWNVQGRLVDEGEYLLGKPVGVHRRWNDFGNLVEEIHYLGAHRSNCKYWDDKGHLRLQREWTEHTCIETYWSDAKVSTREGLLLGNKVQWSDCAPQFISQDGGIPRVVAKNPWDLFQTRFPNLAMQAFSWEEKVAPIETLPQLNLCGIDALFVYGLGGGASFGQVRLWLQENPARRLIFVEDEPGYIVHFLNTSPWVELLEHPQVAIELLEDESMVDRYPLESVEMVALPSRKTALFENYRLELLRKSTLTFALHQDRIHGYHPFSHFVRNIVRLPNCFYANFLKNAFMGMPAIVCGAGPSLQEATIWLKTRSQYALIIAGGSTLAALSAQGVSIHFGMAIDPNLEEYRRFKNNFAFDTPLLFSTRVHPGVFQTSSGPFGYMRTGIGGVMEIWMEEQLNLTDPLIGQDLSSDALSVTTICVAWAQFLGCAQIALCGVDLAYTGGKRYADGVGAQESSLDITSSPDRMIEKVNYAGEKVTTAVRWMMEADALSDFAKKHPEILFYNLSKNGLAIDGIPYLAKEEYAREYIGDIKRQVAALLVNLKESKEIIVERLEELRQSLARVVGSLEILSGKMPGSKALAEVEMEEELAYDLLFYDLRETLSREIVPGDRWGRSLAIAKQYQQCFSISI